MTCKRDYTKDGTSGSYFTAKLTQSAVTMKRSGNMLLLSFDLEDGSEIRLATSIKSLGDLREYYDSVVAEFPHMIKEMDG